VQHIFLLAIGFSSLFIAVPPLIFFRILRNSPIPYLLIAAFGSFLFLRADPSFDVSHLTSWNGVRAPVLPVLLRDTLLLALLGVSVWLLSPDMLFSFVKRAPGFWAPVLFLYPLLSVYPQELCIEHFPSIATNPSSAQAGPCSWPAPSPSGSFASFFATGWPSAFVS